MNILFVTRKHPPMVGGMEKLSHHTTAELSKLAKTYKIALQGSQVWLPLFFIYAFFKALKICKTKRIDVIHLGDPVLTIIGVILKKMFNIPVAVTCHGLDLTYNSKIYQKYLDLLPKLDLFICISTHTRELASRKVPLEKTAVVPIGIGPEFSYNKNKNNLHSIEKEYGINLKNKKILITVGRLVKRKGVMWFLHDVFRQLSLSYSYLIVGNGEEESRINEYVQQNKLQDRVIIITDANDAKVRQLYNVSDIFIMPNIQLPNTVEGFGIVALEASASGLPVVASRIEGITDAVHHEKNGYLVAEKDAEAFKTMIRKIDTKKGKKFSSYTKKNFSWTTIATEYLKLFESMKRATS